MCLGVGFSQWVRNRFRHNRGRGEEAHEFAVLPGGGEVPLAEDGDPDEDALAEAGAFELEAYGRGQDCNGTWELEPGQYTLSCIVQSPDGEPHAEKGMLGELTVDRRWLTPQSPC